MMSIFPSLIALVMIYGLVSDPQDVTRQIEDAMSNVSEEMRKVVGDQVTSIASSHSGALSLGLVISFGLLLWSASSGVATFMKAITKAYQQEETRGFVKLRGVALALVFVALVLAGILVAAVGVVPPLLSDALGSAGLRWALFGVEGLLILLILIGAISLAYRFAPADPPPGWRLVTPGAVVAALALVVFTIVFAFYVNNFGSYNKTYGALAGVIILMLWLYYSAYVVLIGALINAEGEQVARMSD
jgi:membrane protein